MQERKIRVLMAKPGLDGHDRGAKIVSLALRDNGMEVVYMGLHQTPEQIVNAAIQEDVNIIGISILSGAHMAIVPEILREAKDKGFFEQQDRYILLGGTIVLDNQIKQLKDMGVTEIFGPGTPTIEIVNFIQELLKKTK